jgi:hypothetical protein
MKFRDLLEKKLQAKELLDIIKDKEKPEDYWADYLLYQGEELFENYMKFLSWFDDYAYNVKKASWTETETEEVYNDETGEYEDEEFENEVYRDLQESYLGYVPSKDMFITGFDMWENVDSPAGIVLWTMKKGKFKVISENIHYESDMMYGSNGHYKKLHKKYKDLVDIRLD